MEKAGSLLFPVLKRLGIEEGVRLVRIRNDWQEIFGKPLSLHASPSKLTEGELLLTVDSPIWIQQLNYLKKDLLQRLSSYGVKKISFRMGNVRERKQPRRPAGKPEKVSEEEASFVSRLVTDIDDEELKDAVRRAALKSLAARPKRGNRE